MERVAVWAGLLVGLSNAELQRLQVALEFRSYQRKFVRPLQTAHGAWRSRQGLILKLQSSQGSVNYGEIAPIPWFGTETLEEAIAFLSQLHAKGDHLHVADLSTIVERSPAYYSATRFGLGMAIAQLQGHFPSAGITPKPSEICALLPTGSAALAAWQKFWEQGHRTFKWKLGMGELAQELEELATLRRSLPPQANLRLDANGGLNLTAAQRCLRCCDDLANQGSPIEFLEQPLPPDQFPHLLQLSQAYRTPLALDESVTGLTQLKDCHRRGWQGIFVIKGAIAGDPLDVLNYCQIHQLKVVFSSVFETGLARQAVLAMAQSIQSTSHANPHSAYALGFGVSHWLQHDGLNQQGSSIDLKLRGEQLWQQLTMPQQPS